MHINSIYVPEQKINNINIIRGQDILAEIKNKLHIRLLEIFLRKQKYSFFPINYLQALLVLSLGS